MATSVQNTKRKTLIGVLASHDSQDKNIELAQLFDSLYALDQSQGQNRLGKFHFVLTGGTFDRIVLAQGNNACAIPDLTARNFVRDNSTRLPTFNEGGVTILADLVVQRQCNIVWPFLSPITTHWLNPENLALMRLCDIWKDKRLMNYGSVLNWFNSEADVDSKRNNQDLPLKLLSGSDPQNPILVAPDQIHAMGSNALRYHLRYMLQTFGIIQLNKQ